MGKSSPIDSLEAHVTMLGPFPPPMAGAHKNTERIRLDLVDLGATVLALQTGVSSSHAHVKSGGYFFKKLLRFASNAAMLLSSRRPVATVYLVPDGGAGIWLTVVYAFILRLRRCEHVFIHHRNFTFFTRRHSAMASLAVILRDSATHVFLEEEMKALYTDLYGAGEDGLVVRNAATCDISPTLEALEARREGLPLRVGYLSNLTKAKGFDVVAEVFTQLARRHPDVELVLGGRPVGTDEERILEKLIVSAGSSLDYLGHIDGRDKEEFFRGLDVFVFPTRYQQEAQPNVLYEALAGGATIVATDHASIPFMLDGAPCHLVENRAPELVAEAVLSAVEYELELLADPIKRRERHCESVRVFTGIRDAAVVNYRALLNALAGFDSKL